MHGEINHPDDETYPLCAVCSKVAACAGRYEDDENPIAFACHDCCGHGNEDGWCIRLEDIDGWMETVDRSASKLREERDEAVRLLAKATHGGNITRDDTTRISALIRAAGVEP